jgi:D-alanyl-D-alanine carboxypeptidase/D-alanyl-D-alanine-endopeptidase (penicillin-binding protein 4)
LYFGVRSRSPAPRTARALVSLSAIRARGITLVIAATAITPAGTALAQAQSLQASVAHQLAIAGPRDGAYVYDLTAHRVLFSLRSAVARPPASVEKLYTATATLSLLGPAARMQTTVLGAGVDQAGVWEGDLYLRGGGDPTFGSSAFIHSHYGGVGASVSQLAGQLARVDGIRVLTGSVLGDESYFDSLRGEPSSGFAPDPFLEGTLSALAFNRGESGSHTGPHAPAAYAAEQLVAALHHEGVVVEGGAGVATTPPGSTRLALVSSPAIAELLHLMLPPSDNFFAETLLKDLGARFGHAGTIAAGAAVVAHTIASVLGIDPHIVDGSGLSPADRTSPAQVVHLLASVAGTSLGTVLRSSMAVAGDTGTLALRMRGTRAAGNCQGKTGTLTGVSNLAGYCRAANGHTIAFAVFTDGIPIELAHTVQDHIAISIADL